MKSGKWKMENPARLQFFISIFHFQFSTFENAACPV